MQIIFAIVGLLYNGMSTSYATHVNLAPSNVTYFSNGDSLTLMCTVDQDVYISSVLFRRDTQAYVEIVDAAMSTCTPSKYISSDASNYSVKCDQQRNFTLIKKGNNAEEHRKKWQCILLSNTGGPCRGANNPCISPAVVAILQVPVTTVQLIGSGQVLYSSINIVRGQSTGIRCSTANNGSRPRATFQWYIRQGNQSPVLIVDQSISLTPDPITVPGQAESDILISYSTWTLTGNPSYHNKYIYCEARDETNTGNYIQSYEIQINIVYAPAVHLTPDLYAYNVTEGRQNFVLTCNIIEANPLPQPNSYSWFHNTSIIPGQTSSSYTLPSVQRSDAGEYRCTARNDYGTGTSNSLDLNVQYAPDVRVYVSGITAVGSTAVLMCVPQGNPPQYTFHPWIHVVGQTEIRRLDGVNTVGLSNLTLSNIGIQDMGTYICTVDNSITGLDGQINRTGDSHVEVQGLPVINKTQTTFVGEPFKSASIQIPFYSYTSIKMQIFIKQLDSSVTVVSNTSDISIYIQPSNFTMMFYMKKVTISGYMAVLYFRNVTETDFGNYTLQLSNDKGNVSVQAHFIASVHPSKPMKFFFSHIEDGRLVFGIEKGFNGGHDQTFIVEYQPSGMPNATWSTIFRINENDLDDPFSNGTCYIKIPKIQDGQYIFRVYAENEKGNSSAIEGVYAEIKAEPLPVGTDVQVGAVVGGAVGGILLVVVIVVVVVVMKRRTLKPKMKAFEREVDSTDQNHRKSQLVDNPVYDPTISRSGTGIAVVTHVEDSSTLYAQVNKTKTNKEKATAKGKHGKTSKAPSKGKHGKTSRGEIYENATQVMKSSAESEYENPGQLATGPSSGDNVYETPEESASKGKMVGLLYADVILGPPTKKGGKPIIHGEEDRTEYAEIAYGKRGEPLPETDEEKENGGAKKKNETKSSTDE